MTDNLERLWAGWRAAYMIAGVGPPAMAAEPVEADPHAHRCVLCQVIASASEVPTRHVYQGDNAVVVMNAFPYNNGHVLVLPRRHVDRVEALDAAERAEFWQLVTSATTALRLAYQPDGINMGINEGRAAGAGLPDHLHAHVLPRWFGDTSFTTTVAGTRVIPEDLEVSAARIRDVWPR